MDLRLRREALAREIVRTKMTSAKSQISSCGNCARQGEKA